VFLSQIDERLNVRRRRALTIFTLQPTPPQTLRTPRNLNGLSIYCLSVVIQAS